MSTYEWLSIIGLLVAGMIGIYKILAGIKRDISEMSLKIIPISLMDLHIENKLLEHKLNCPYKAAQNDTKRI